MGGFRFDWRWLALIGFVALLANAATLPWPITALALSAAGSTLLWMAWQAWRDGSSRRAPATTNVTYWRGARSETPTAPRRFRAATWPAIAPVMVYALLGAALLLAALALLLRIQAR